MDMKKAIEQLESFIKDPTVGLPEDIFLFASRITPLVNVDILIKNEQNKTLLTWRDDGYYPAGWHIPGGIVRFKETFARRIEVVAAKELGASVVFKEKPLVFKEVILPEFTTRGHAISFLYECTLTSPPDEKLRYRDGLPVPGQWAWHDRCPDNIITVHRMYKDYI